MSNKLNLKVAIAGIFLASIAATAGAGQEITIPEAPASVVAKSNAQDKGPINLLVKSEIAMSPNVRELIPIAMSEINRIKVPFENVKIQTSTSEQQAAIKINGNIIYVTPYASHRISMFVYEKDDPENAMAITLFPRENMPGADISLNWSSKKSNNAAVAANLKKAEKWEKSGSYMEGIRNSFRAVALGDIPTGYNLGEINGKKYDFICEQPGAKFTFDKGQIMAGKNLNIIVGVVSNVSSEEIELRDESCLIDDVAAVSYWPRVTLMPGEKSEVVLALRQGFSLDVKEQTSQKRRSLIH